MPSISLRKNDFYKKIRERCEKNVEEGNDMVLTKDQIVNIVIDLKIPVIKKEKRNYLENIIQKTTFGDIILN